MPNIALADRPSPIDFQALVRLIPRPSFHLQLKCRPMTFAPSRPWPTRTWAWASTAALLAGCATAPSDEPAGTAGPHMVVAVTEQMQLIQFNAGTPRRIDKTVALSGLQAGETLVGIDYRVARGVLYGVTSQGRLLTIDTSTGATAPVGSAPATALQGKRFGVDFNPAADRLRVVSDTGQNLRLHPDTGALAANDPALSSAGAPAANVTAAAYTYNKQNDKLTTNYAIDTGRGWLVTQGSVEGVQPVVSPNTGRITDVGPLGTGAVDDAAFDIADTDNTALVALRKDGRTRLYSVDLATGRAQLRGSVGDGKALRGIAIQP